MSGVIELTPDLLRAMPLPRHEEETDKDGRGRVLVIGGSVEVPGAVLLSAIGALRAGAGKLQIATCRSAAINLGLAVPEALVTGLDETDEGGIAPAAAALLVKRADRCDAVLIGPGMADQPAVDALTAALIAGLRRPTLVLDAAALIGLDQQVDALREHDGRVVLTPHAGEMAGMLGVDRDEVMADPEGTVRRAARMLHAVVALKGTCTLIAAPDGRVWTYGGGGVVLATSGSGDTLAGIVTGLLARGAAPEVGLLWGVLLHGEAGRVLARTRGRVGFLARELLAEVPAIMAGLDSEAGESPPSRSGC